MASTSLTDDETLDIREWLAAIEHERWSHWQEYMHSLCERTDDGRLIIPADKVAHWEKLIATQYSELSEHSKESDREQVDRYLPKLKEAGLLLPTGGVTRMEFAIFTGPVDRPAIWSFAHGIDKAKRYFEQAVAGFCDNPRIMCREVTVWYEDIPNDYWSKYVTPWIRYDEWLKG